MTPQQYLNELAISDKYGFLEPSADNYGSHRPLLYLGLSLTEGLVTELGSGESSTPYLRKYCTDRPFNSYDSNQDWAVKMNSHYISDWDICWSIWGKECGLLFVDNAPGEHRAQAIWEMKDLADIQVIHDTELNGGGAYGLEPLWPYFKHVIHINRTGGGAGATMVSNKIDLNQYKGCEFGGRVIE